MNIVRAIGLVTIVVAAAGCTRMGPTPTTGPVMAPPVTATPATLPPPPAPEPAPAASAPIQQASLASPQSYRFLDAAAVPLLSAAARTEATNAQFYALQFGRPGAPRTWSSGGSSGQVTVGPYVRVNNLDCREFSHRATVGGESYTRSGTACRDAGGSWDITDA